MRQTFAEEIYCYASTSGFGSRNFAPPNFLQVLRRPHRAISRR
jgi:hypothetical protein